MYLAASIAGEPRKIRANQKSNNPPFESVANDRATMSNRSDGYDDRVYRALVGGSVYERLRYERRWLFTQSIGRKLRLQSIELFLLAAGVPLLFGYPSGLASALEGDPFASAPNIAILGLIGGAITFFAGLGLVGVALGRERLEPMDEETAASILAVEEVASLVGFVTGGTTIAVTLLFVVLGVADTATMEAYVATLGQNPFADTAVDIPMVLVSGLAFVGGVTLHTAAGLLDRFVVER